MFEVIDIEKWSRKDHFFFFVRKSFGSDSIDFGEIGKNRESISINKRRFFLIIF